jgi:Ca-activated chloride channel family protein
VNFSFDNPILAAASLVIIPVTAFILYKLKNPFTSSIPLGAPGGVPFKGTEISGFVKLLKVLEFISVFLLFLSAAGPFVKTSETVWLNRGADIIFVLDISPSMAALDMDGTNRFNTARNLLSAFLHKRPSDNIGLVAVGEDAALLVPPTSDRQAINARLDRLRIGDLGDGTALGNGLTVAAYHLDKSNAKRKAAVIITDGENNAGIIHPETAASLLRDMGVSFYVIAVGSAGEVPIDYLDPYTKIRRTGIFDSRYDINSLRRLSDIGGGTFISAPNLEAFANAFAFLDDSELTVQRTRIIHKKRPVFLYFFIPAIFLLIMVKFTRTKILGAIL